MTKEELRNLIAASDVQVLRFQTFSKSKPVKSTKVVPHIRAPRPRYTTPMTVQLPPVELTKRFDTIAQPTTNPHRWGVDYEPRSSVPAYGPPARTCPSTDAESDDMLTLSCPIDWAHMLLNLPVDTTADIAEAYRRWSADMQREFGPFKLRRVSREVAHDQGHEGMEYGALPCLCCDITVEFLTSGHAGATC
jgi:hypothetical protein